MTDSPLTQALLDQLGMLPPASAFHSNPGSGPAADIDIVVGQDSGCRVQRACWWLLLENGEKGLKPSRYNSFNTRSDKLDQRNSAGFIPYRQSRCLIPATYIIEGEGSKGKRRYHRIAPLKHAFLLGGLFRHWLDRQSGETRYSCSVITLPPTPAWRSVHSKSTPLFLPAEPDVLMRWISPAVTDVNTFASLLEASPPTVTCTPIWRPGDQQVVGEPFVLEGRA